MSEREREREGAERQRERESEREREREGAKRKGDIKSERESKRCSGQVPESERVVSTWRQLPPPTYPLYSHATVTACVL